MEELITEYSEVRYCEKENVVFLVWKKRAILENYRKPTAYAMELLKKHKDSNFIVDARNGFEDDTRDVLWAFDYLLPEMSKSSCTFVVFIMNEMNEVEIGKEMDMWTLEFGKYFAVTKCDSYENAVESTKNFIEMNVRYSVKTGKREEFYQKIVSGNIDKASREEPGNIKYEFYYPLDDDNAICLQECWTNEREQKRHIVSEHYKQLGKLKEEYVLGTRIEKNVVCNGIS